MTSSKTILITGASRGIGRLTAETLAARGHTVYAGMRDLRGRNQAIAAEICATADEAGSRLIPIDLDVTDAGTCDAAVAQIEAERPLDVLVNNAGIMPVGLTEGFTDAQMKAYFDVNMFGLARMSQAVLPAMRERRSGLLVHLSSSAGRLAIPFFGVYCASKWAMEAYAESLHYELEPFGIESILIEPSGHATGLVEVAPAPDAVGVVESYGAMGEGRDKLLGMFKSLFAEGHAGNDAQKVADLIASLIEMEAPREIRHQIGDDMGVSAINESTAPVQAGLVDALRPVYAA